MSAYYFKNFLISAYQNNLKTTTKLISNKKINKFCKTWFLPKKINRSSFYAYPIVL